MVGPTVGEGGDPPALGDGAVAVDGEAVVGDRTPARDGVAPGEEEEDVEDLDAADEGVAPLEREEESGGLLLGGITAVGEGGAADGDLTIVGDGLSLGKDGDGKVEI